MNVLITTAKNHGYIQFRKLCCCLEVISVSFNCHYIICVSIADSFIIIRRRVEIVSSLDFDNNGI